MSRVLVVTRPLVDAHALADRLATAGHTTIVLPAIAIAPVADPSPIAATMARLDDYRLVVFVSANAIRHALARRRPWPHATLAGVMGPSSRAVLDEHASIDDASVLMPAGARDDASTSRLDSEALFVRIEQRFATDGGDAAGAADRRPILIVKGEGGRPWLATRLRERGHAVETLDCYRRVRPPVDPAVVRAIAHHVAAGDAIELVVTSSEGLDHLLAMAPQMLAESKQMLAEGKDSARSWLLARTLHVPHARIAENATRLGFADVRLTAPGDDGIVASIK